MLAFHAEGGSSEFKIRTIKNKNWSDDENNALIKRCLNVLSRERWVVMIPKSHSLLKPQWLIGFILSILVATIFFSEAFLLSAQADEEKFDATYYVSKDGDDTNGDGSETNPWASLAKTANVINASGKEKNYQVIVMTNLTSTACARYYGNSVKITSPEGMLNTVTRGKGFAQLADPVRSRYNPAMLEIGNTGSDGGPIDPYVISLTLTNIIFDDAGLFEGTKFAYHPSNGQADDCVQDAIVASYNATSTIILDRGATLKNFGGMNAIFSLGANIVLKNGSLITDEETVIPNDFRSNGSRFGNRGDGAVRANHGSFKMESGAQITNIADVYGVSGYGAISFFMDGTITGLRGTRNAGDDQSGRGNKCAIFLSGTTNAVIGPNGQVVNNGTKSGAVQVRGGNTQLSVEGKINDNLGLSGIRKFAGFEFPAGTNGGGLFVIGGGHVYLEEGSEVCNNKVENSAYGGAASIQQGSSNLIMNGGKISGNSAPSSPGIAVNKHNASFIMNGGIIDNGINAVHLLYEKAGGYETNGNLLLNGGTVSGVTIQSSNAFGNSTQRHLFVSKDVAIESDYASVAGRKVTPLSRDFSIGNPRTENYTPLRDALPVGWKMPTSNSNIIGFWVQKIDTLTISVPKPNSGTPPTNYDRTLDTYYLAVQGTNADGTFDPASPVKFYPTLNKGDHLVISVPLGEYGPNGATIALVQPANKGALVFDAPEKLESIKDATTYRIPSTAIYTTEDMMDSLEGIHGEMVTNGFSPENTVVTLFIKPDNRCAIDPSTFKLDSSALFEIAGSAKWNASTKQLEVPLRLKKEWAGASDKTSAFSFDCTLSASEFVDGETLYLTGNMVITGGVSTPQLTYNINGTTAETLMVHVEPVDPPKPPIDPPGPETPDPENPNPPAPHPKPKPLLPKQPGGYKPAPAPAPEKAPEVVHPPLSQKPNPPAAKPPTTTKPAEKPAEPEEKPVWSLLSLIMVIVGLVVSLVLLVLLALKSSREQRSLSLRAVIVVVSVITLIVWLIVDNITWPMAVINTWTPLIGLLFLIQLLAFVGYLIQKSDDNEEQDKKKVKVK